MTTAETINPESPSGLCAICENAVEDWQPHAVAVVHGGKYLCHDDCLYDEEDAE